MRAIISEALRKVLRVIYKGRGGKGIEVLQNLKSDLF
jgi:hypothetical protein